MFSPFELSSSSKQKILVPVVFHTIVFPRLETMLATSKPFSRMPLLYSLVEFYWTFFKLRYDWKSILTTVLCHLFPVLIVPDTTQCTFLSCITGRICCFVTSSACKTRNGCGIPFNIILEKASFVPIYAFWSASAVKKSPTHVLNKSQFGIYLLCKTELHREQFGKILKQLSVCDRCSPVVVKHYFDLYQLQFKQAITLEMNCN